MARQNCKQSFERQFEVGPDDMGSLCTINKRQIQTCSPSERLTMKAGAASMAQHNLAECEETFQRVFCRIVLLECSETKKTKLSCTMILQRQEPAARSCRMLCASLACERTKINLPCLSILQVLPYSMHACKPYTVCLYHISCCSAKARCGIA